MDAKELNLSANSTEARLRTAVSQTAPGTALRHALDMIIAGHMGALICIGDTENVLAAGDDGFKLNISFTANRLFELSKMDGAIVVDKGLTQILRANYHLNPDPSLPTSETGMRHRTAARMSQLTNAMVISVSERRQVVTVFIDGGTAQKRFLHLHAEQVLDHILADHDFLIDFASGQVERDGGRPDLIQGPAVVGVDRDIFCARIMQERQRGSAAVDENTVAVINESGRICGDFVSQPLYIRQVGDQARGLIHGDGLAVDSFQETVPLEVLQVSPDSHGGNAADRRELFNRDFPAGSHAGQDRCLPSFNCFPIILHRATIIYVY